MIARAERSSNRYQCGEPLGAQIAVWNRWPWYVLSTYQTESSVAGFLEKLTKKDADSQLPVTVFDLDRTLTRKHLFAVPLVRGSEQAGLRLGFNPCPCADASLQGEASRWKALEGKPNRTIEAACPVAAVESQGLIVTFRPWPADSLQRDARASQHHQRYRPPPGSRSLRGETQLRSNSSRTASKIEGFPEQRRHHAGRRL